VILNVRRKVLMGICIEGFIFYSGQLEAHSAMNRSPVKLLEKRLQVGLAVRLENNSGKRILNALEFICDIMG